MRIVSSSPPPGLGHLQSSALAMIRLLADSTNQRETETAEEQLQRDLKYRGQRSGFSSLFDQAHYHEMLDTVIDIVTITV